MSIVLLQLVGLNPLVATLLVDMDFMVIRTDGNFCKGKTKKTKQHVDRMEVQITNKLDQFQVGFKQQAEILSQITHPQHKLWDSNIFVFIFFSPLFSKGLI